MNCPLQRRSQMLRNRGHARTLWGRRSQLRLGGRSDSVLHVSEGQGRADPEGRLVQGAAAVGVGGPGGDGADAPHGRGGRGSLRRVRGRCPRRRQRGGGVGVRAQGPRLGRGWGPEPAAQRRPQRPPRRGHAGADHVRRGLRPGRHGADAPHDAGAGDVHCGLFETQTFISVCICAMGWRPFSRKTEKSTRNAHHLTTYTSR